MSAQEQKKATPAAPLFLETFKETSGVYPFEKIQHEKYGIGFRVRFGETTCTVFRPPGETPRVEINTPEDVFRKKNVTSVKLVAAEKGEAFDGILFTSSRGGLWVRADGSYASQYTAPSSEPLEEQASPPPADTTQAATSENGNNGTEKQRVKESGFFGKILEGFPREVGEEKRRIYKLLIGNPRPKEQKKNPNSEKEEIDWITVTAHAPHVVKFLDEHIGEFSKRETRLQVEGYYQEFETTLRRTGKVKKTQELYALTISFVPGTPASSPPPKS